MKIEFKKHMREETERLCSRIKTVTTQLLKKDGVVVGLSGGIDSALTATLCVKALGKDKVLGVILPEKDSSPESKKLAADLAEKLGIKYVVNEITPTLEGLNIYNSILEVIRKYYPDFTEDMKYKIILPNKLLTKRMLNLYALVIEDSEGKEICRKRLGYYDYKKISAALSVKLRIRMVNLYYQAESVNYAVAGTTNRSEYELGNFCKYGDGGVDFEVIAHLYKTEVYQMSKYNEIDQRIIDRPPSPDTCSAFVTDEDFFFSLPLELLDKLLYAYNHYSVEETAQILELEVAQVESIFKDFTNKKNNTNYLKEMPIACIEIEN
ncbi:NAD(+) synthase [Cellulosilyticum ruminicola]|uniref:NAD(+) synthase n=1 Tax=Cellulosilyticum ruminicola TaxID=425254 RepID=UPI000B0A4E44|nr:NAD(+) synthase [Cellulosilyticum ruminicola]